LDRNSCARWVGKRSQKMILKVNVMFHDEKKDVKGEK